jgi:acyl-CoA thioester hydrolase
MMERRVAYYETDRMGIVHHSNYIRYMEEARLTWLEENGLAYDKMEAMGVMLPVVSVNATYEKPLKFGDTFKVETRLTALTNVKITLSYVVSNATTGDTCAVGESVHCFVNNDFKPIALKRLYPDTFKLFQDALCGMPIR